MSLTNSRHQEREQNYGFCREKTLTGLIYFPPLHCEARRLIES